MPHLFLRENRVRNAYEAMPQGGTLTVRTLREEPEAGAVLLSVEDTGEGMDARARERPGACVRRGVEAHGGEVSLTSREGRGTLVRLRLPVRGVLGGTPAPGEGAPWPSR